MSAKIRQVFALCAVLLAWSSYAAASSIYDFQTIPASGNISGGPGSTIGWGYLIANNDTDTWLEIADVNADPFLHVSSTGPFFFDYPILAPMNSATLPFVTNTSGLWQLTWDLSAPIGFVNSGTFYLTANVWDGDPTQQGSNYLDTIQLTSGYSATVAGATPVPEPGTMGLLGLGLAFACRKLKASRA